MWTDDDLHDLFPNGVPIVHATVRDVPLPEKRRRVRRPRTHDPRTGNRDTVRAERWKIRAKRWHAKIIDFDIDQWKLLLSLYESRCAYCGETTKYLYPDHVVPLCKSGNHTLSNIVPACPECNYLKGDYTLAESGMDFAIYISPLAHMQQQSLFEDGE